MATTTGQTNPNFVSSETPEGAYVGYRKVKTAGDAESLRGKNFEDPRLVGRKDPTDEKIRNVQYPAQGGNDHFVRFFINVNEESRLIKYKLVEFDQNPIDNTNQNRASQNSQTTESVVKGSAAAGALAGASLGAKWSAYGVKKMFASGGPASKAKVAGAVAGAAIATAGSAVVGGAAGAGIGAIASEQFHLTNKLYRLKSCITLYTPADIRADYSMEYNMTDDLLTALAQQDQFEAIQKGVTSPGDWMKDITKVGRIIASTNKTVSMLSKTAVNPKQDIMFKRVNNRQFQFNYTFAPKSADEARDVADIIFMFKHFSHPEMLPGYGNFLYLYPAEFDIEYGIKNSDGSERVNDSLNKISSCVLEAVSINYAPNGSYQSLANGEPIFTTVSLNFREIEALHQGRIQKGY